MCECTDEHRQKRTVPLSQKGYICVRERDRERVRARKDARARAKAMGICQWRCMCVSERVGELVNE